MGRSLLVGKWVGELWVYCSITGRKRKEAAGSGFFSVSQKRHAPGGTHFCLLRRTEIPSPWWLRFPAFAAPVAAGLQKADRCPCSASAVSSAGRASASQSLGTKLSAE